MQMQVEIFNDKSGDVIVLQKLINNWLGNHPDIQVEHITQSQVQHGQQMSMPITICIWYGELLK